MNLDILVSTMGNRLDILKKNICSCVDEYKYIISCQGKVKKNKSNIFSNKSNVNFFYCNKKGLSNNRNNALKYSQSDIALISDDDTKFVKNFYKIILDAYEKIDADVILFKAGIMDENFHLLGPYKKYPKKMKNIKNIFWYSPSSIEISFRRSSIEKNGILFNENIGLGSNNLNSGEESFFIKDCLKKKLKVVFIPKYIVMHPIRPKESLNDDSIISNGANIYLRFGKLSYVFIFLHILKRYTAIKKKSSIKNYTRLLKIGINRMKMINSKRLQE